MNWMVSFSSSPVPHILSGRVSLPARLPLSLSVRQESLAGGALEFALVLHICRLWRQWDSFCVYALLVCSVVFWTDINNFSSFVSVHIVPTYFDSPRLVFLVDYRLHLFLETDDNFFCFPVLLWYSLFLHRNHIVTTAWCFTRCFQVCYVVWQDLFISKCESLFFNPAKLSWAIIWLYIIYYCFR